MKLNRHLLTTVIAIIISSISVFAQKTDYSAAWKKIDALIEKEGRPQTALAEVKKIYNAAKAEKNDPQYIKALVYMARYQEQTRENNLPLSIKEIETEIKTAREPAVSILKSFLATKYLQFFQNNRYKLYDRTETIAFKKDDIETWTTEDLHKKISSLYLESIANANLLKQTKPESFEAVIYKGNTRKLRPTLFDLLSHQALSYFKNDERLIRKPAYAFEIEQAEAFGTAGNFASFRFVTKDSLSLHHKALLIYQELIEFHLKNNNTAALMDADLERLQFVQSHSTHEDKEELFRKALEQIITSNKSTRITYQAQYLLASYYYSLARQYNPYGDTSYRYEMVKAVSMLEKIVADSAVKNEGWINSYNLLKQIQHPSFSFQLEKVNLPSKPFRSLVTFRNVDQLYFRLIRVSSQLNKRIEYGMDEKYWSEIIKASPIRAWNQKLPSTNDFQQHKAEIKIDGLPSGQYILLGSESKEFTLNENLLGSQVFNVSEISYVNNDNVFFVLHRETGLPLQKARATVYERIYDYKEGRYSKKLLGNYSVNEKGFFTVNKTSEKQQPFMVDIFYGKDTLAQEESYYTYSYYGEDRSRNFTRIIFFTDRSIYRPGQEVYFKGIAINNQDKVNKIAVDYSSTIYLRDANYQVVDSVRFTSNEFGSFSGKFQLPQNILTGMFQLADKESRNSVSFSVEEYKRPKFFVDYEKIKETYKVGQTIHVTGTAKAYAGNNISDAKVVYRVVRTPRFIYPWPGWRSWLPPTAPMEITSGETTTDKDGKFQISFTAIPDKKIKISFDPLFDYVVYADVTDMNGETRSGEKRITAGYKSLVLQTNIPQQVIKDSLRTLNIRTENLNGEFQKTLVHVKFTRLIPEKRLIRSRYWARPDVFVMSKEEFLSSFPNDEYQKEKDPANWEKGEVVFSASDSSRADGKWQLVNHSIPAGHYELEITTTDKEGKEVKTLQVIEVYENNHINPASPQYFIFRPATGSIEPGETTNAYVGSSANIYLVRHIDKQKQGSAKPDFSDLDQHTITNQFQTFSYTATEADRGGYGVHYFFIKDNRIYQATDVISVPWTNKELDISYASFRDKTLPGSHEKWKITIKGKKNEQLAAELLASMYDASLDQFKPHQWTNPGIWQNYSPRSNWNARGNFISVSSQHLYGKPPHQLEFAKIYDRFIFSSDFGNEYGFIRRRGMENMEISRAPSNMAPYASNKYEELQMADASGKIAYDTVAQSSIDDPSKVVEYIVTRREVSGEPSVNQQEFQVRNNFNETAFFFPHLQTDADGNISFEFTLPEALTRWKFQALAHTKELAMGISQKEIVTQKDMMVQTNAPRFIRQGDRIEFSTKIANLSEKEITGKVELQLFNAATNQPVDGWFLNSRANQYFTVAAGGSEAVSFPLQVPFDFNEPLTWRIVAVSGNYSDGEENMLPVLSNKVLVTETLPLHIRGEGRKDFSFDKLKNAGNSSTLQHHALTVEYTANPAWFAVQALPYLNDYPYDCAEQVWNRYYANALASKIANASPRLQMVFEKWKNTDTAALISNLQKNQELKNILLEETPWVMAANSETEQKKNIALLFDMIRMSKELKANLEKLKTMQSPNGGFVWFQGGPDDRYITQYIMTGIGHISKLGVDISALSSIVNAALPYLDRKIKADYDALVSSKADRTKQQLSYVQIQYLYMRSFFKKDIPAASKIAYNYYLAQANKYWLNQNKYMQGMIALVLHRKGDQQTPSKILTSLKETSMVDEEMGRYWKDVRFGFSWFWWHAPIETQSLLIEAFAEITKDNRIVDDMKTWLIKNKQTTHWRTTRATADACYAMLLQGTNWLEAEPTVTVSLGNMTYNSQQENTEAGTGYFQKKIEGTKVDPSMGNISLTIRPSEENKTASNSMPSWGAVYWQYFEEMDKVEAASTPLKLDKKLFLQKNSDRGPVLIPVTESTNLKPGDKITVRVELRVDRDMEYVHMKDLRASALEPVNVLSGYKWKGGLGYYESTRDASTNFFFSYLPKGTYVFEYSLFVSHKGSFSNGITTIQSLYAPEFSAHSEGVKLRVD